MLSNVTFVMLEFRMVESFICIELSNIVELVVSVLNSLVLFICEFVEFEFAKFEL